ncbi:MAG: hypothetical protein LAO07_07480 [Acidobacteriia bacterium]|nr:hypothetical protein [Terriglobia bacterium]
MVGKTKTFAASGALAIFVLVVAGAQHASPPRWGGEEWLSWSAEVRSVFVDAYLAGYTSGKSAACMAADDLFELDKVIHDPKDAVVARCKRHAKSYSKTSDYYAKVITEFYQKYPKYRNIPYAYLMFLMTDDWYKTADEIYQAALEGKIRTTF